MPGESREVAFSILLDQHGKPFVRDVQASMEAVGTAGAAAGGKLRTGLGQILGSGFLLRIAAVGYMLKRMADMAEPTASMRAMRGEVHALGMTVGEELQMAFSQTAEAMRPVIHLFNESGGAAQGAVVGLVAFLSTARTLRMVLLALGTTAAATGPIMATVMGLMMVTGAVAMQKADEAVAKMKGMESYREHMARMMKEQTEEEIKAQKQTISDLRRKREEIERTAPVLREEGVMMRSISSGYGRQLLDLDRQLADHEQMLTIDQARLDFLAEMGRKKPLEITDDLKTASEKFDELNTKIATGEMSLAEARKEAQEFQKTVIDKRVIDAADAFQRILEEVSAEYKAQGKDVMAEAVQKEMTAEATKRQLALMRTAQAEQRAGRQFDVSMGDRESAASQKQTQEVLNRKLLIAEIVDLERGRGPVMQLQTLQAEYQAQLAHGHRADETHMLELKKQIVAAEKELTELARTRADQMKQFRDHAREEYRQAQQRATAFRESMDVALLKLQFASEEEYRRRRIADLQRELGLTKLTEKAIREKGEAIREAERLSGRGGVSAEDAARYAQQRSHILELVNLIDEQKRSEQEAWRPLVTGAEDASRAAARAMVQVFHRGTKSAKEFSEEMVAIFENMIAEMLGKAIFQSLVNLILMIFSLGAGGGGGIGRMFARSNEMAGFGTVPHGFPMPRWPGATPASLAGIENRLDRLQMTMAELARTEMQDKTTRIRGEDLEIVRGRVQRRKAQQRL